MTLLVGENIIPTIAKDATTPAIVFFLEVFVSSISTFLFTASAQFFISPLEPASASFTTFVPQFSQNLASGLRFSPQTLQYINTLSYPNKILRIAITLLYHLVPPPQPNIHLVAN